MPENFTSLLEALNDEGRTLAEPAPLGLIEALGKARRRRHRFTAAASAVAVCAVGAGAALSAGGTTGGPTPITPITPVSPPVSSPSPAPAPAPASNHAVTPANRVGWDALMQPFELPQPALFQWSPTVTHDDSVTGSSVSPTCGLDPSEKTRVKLHAQQYNREDYAAASGESYAAETVYHYGSAAAARADYHLLAPDETTCPSVHVVATVPGGAAWQDAVSGTTSFHKMIVLSGSDIAYWSYTYTFQSSGKPYDTSDDQAALQRMADRLDGRNPVPDPAVAPPADALPASAWLDPSEIPFGTADGSRGWVPQGSQQQTTTGNPSEHLCESVTDGDQFVAQMNAVVTSRSYHGTPSTTPVHPGSNYLYSSADQHIVSFPGKDAAEEAKMVFEWTRQILVAHGCEFTDASGVRITRKIEIATVTDTGFSLLATDMPGPGYEHLYCVIKGSHVAWTVIRFEQGDTSTDGDAAILASMRAHLP